MDRSVSQAVLTLGVDGDHVKTWARLFKDYLSAPANPEKGSPRSFTDSDMLALMHVATLWEEEPDMENIKTGLNCEYHFDNERIAKVFISTRLSCSNRRPTSMRHGDTASF